MRSIVCPSSGLPNGVTTKARAPSRCPDVVTHGTVRCYLYNLLPITTSHQHDSIPAQTITICTTGCHQLHPTPGKNDGVAALQRKLHIVQDRHTHGSVTTRYAYTLILQHRQTNRQRARRRLLGGNHATQIVYHRRQAGQSPMWRAPHPSSTCRSRQDTDIWMAAGRAQAHGRDTRPNGRAARLQPPHPRVPT